MPQSKKREHHHQNVPLPHKAAGKKNHSVVYVSIIFFGLLGMGIAFFTAGTAITWLATGGVIGGIAGYFFGHQIDKVITK